MGRPLGLCTSTDEYEYVHGLPPLKDSENDRVDRVGDMRIRRSWSVSHRQR